MESKWRPHHHHHQQHRIAGLWYVHRRAITLCRRGRSGEHFVSAHAVNHSPMIWSALPIRACISLMASAEHGTNMALSSSPSPSPTQGQEVLVCCQCLRRLATHHWVGLLPLQVCILVDMEPKRHHHPHHHHQQQRVFTNCLWYVSGSTNVLRRRQWEEGAAGRSPLLCCP